MERQKVLAQARLNNLRETTVAEISNGSSWWEITQEHQFDQITEIFFGKEVLEEIQRAFLSKPTQILLWMAANGGTKNSDGSVIFGGVKVYQGRIGYVVREGNFEYTDEWTACLTTQHRIAYRKVGTLEWLPL